MQAKETKIQDIIKGTKQYVIPLFQRTYSWTKEEWDMLWRDLVDLCEAENPRTHFIGSIVTMPTVSVPEGVSKYLLIDGQQRLTTIFILLTLLRDKAKELHNEEFANEIHHTLLVNPYKRGNDFFKIMPTQIDREAYKNLIDGNLNKAENQLTRAYDFFDRKLKQVRLEQEQIKKVLTNYFTVVSIVLDVDDNPYLVFESLNAKGRPLTPADLIRNYFFMRIHIDQQEEVYRTYWQPMQDALGDNLTEYIRHFLMRHSAIIKQTEVYYGLKSRVNTHNAVDYLKELWKFSVYYQRFVYPAFETDLDLQKCFERLNRIEVTTAYPLLLNLYKNYEDGEISKDGFMTILHMLENYLIRRFVCAIPTNQLNKIFSTVSSQIVDQYPRNIVEGFKHVLQGRGYPKDHEFSLRFRESNFYGGGDRLKKTQLILETLEEHYAHKEQVAFTGLTIEHIMPQTLSEWWQTRLGEDWEETHELCLHTIGNLTLTAYNREMSNDDFPTKKHIYNESHLELNKYFKELTSWSRHDIEQRSAYLATKALDIWPYFGQSNSTMPDAQPVTGTTPSSLKVLGQTFEVNSWRDVFERTMNVIAELEPEKFAMLAHHFSRYIGKEKHSKFRAIRQLRNGYFIEVNISAQTIQRLCRQAMETMEPTSEEWEVTVT